MNFSFFTMEFWLSRSLSHELFFFHGGILAIKGLSYELFFFHTVEFWLSRAFHTNFSFFTMEFSKCTIWGKTLLKIRLVKNLAS
jgi:hypothetical protein